MRGRNLLFFLHENGRTEKRESRDGNYYFIKKTAVILEEEKVAKVDGAATGMLKEFVTSCTRYNVDIKNSSVVLGPNSTLSNFT